MGTRGTITKLPDNKGIAGVQMGILNSMLPISDLLIIPESTVSVNGTKQKYSGKRAGGDHTDRKSTRLNSSHVALSRMPSSA